MRNDFEGFDNMESKWGASKERHKYPTTEDISQVAGITFFAIGVLLSDMGYELGNRFMAIGL